MAQSRLTIVRLGQAADTNVLGVMGSKTCTSILYFLSLSLQWVLRKRNILFKYRRLGTVGIFTYYEINLGRILNNIASHGNIKQNRCQPWQE
jgi:hypothetical protein